MRASRNAYNGIAVEGKIVADPLYLSLWFSDFEADEMLPKALSVMRQFPFSSPQPGITGVGLHPVSWNEATILERHFNPGITPEAAVLIASDLLHSDYAYVFEAAWDLWLFDEEQRKWALKPSGAKFVVHGEEFEDGSYQTEGHIQVDFGLDSPFLQEQLQLNSEGEERVRANVQKLVEFTNKAEQASSANARLLRSDSEDNLAQKLVARLQRVQ
ncbi:MAG: hypothetical protein JOZ80_06345 [Acidobacteriaceae bacterium]|nr:hypothetical protein [Acidobacteriaceae bacterium]